jgi:hypothetical protein
MQNVKNSCHQIGIKTGIQDANKATTCNTTKKIKRITLFRLEKIPTVGDGLI